MLQFLAKHPVLYFLLIIAIYENKIRAGETSFARIFSGLHFRTDCIIQKQQIDDAACFGVNVFGLRCLR